jgi:hypothetical protein
VLYVVPTFRWKVRSSRQGALSRQRLTGLRVYLDRPWWSSGEGEELGVILWAAEEAGNQKEVPEELTHLVTQWGADPIWRTSSLPTPRPAPAAFTRQSHWRTGKLLEESPGHAVTVVGHSVEFDSQRVLWFCDIDVDTTTYTPFLRLALARFQPSSVEGAYISRVVMTDIAQLAASRTLAVVRGAAAQSQLSIGLVGSSPVGPEKERNRAEAILEALSEGGDPELGWSPVPAEGARLELKSLQGQDGTTTWNGTLTVPAGAAGRLRVVVREYEVLPSDASPDEGAQRLVYADAVEIS